MVVIECFCFNCFSKGIKEDSKHEVINKDLVKCLNCNTKRSHPILIFDS